MDDRIDRLRFELFDKKKHDRGSFDCGVEELTTYLKKTLGQHARKDVTRGYVLADSEGKIAGYITLSSSLLRVEVIPEGKGYSTRMPLPAALLGRLAVDLSFQGKGLGSRLLIEAFRLALATSETIGTAVIEVDAKDQSAKNFYSHFGFQSLVDDDRHMYIPMKTVRKALNV